ncbi:hypothetical protein MASR1M49_43930 [Pararhodobacter aggregans]
MLRSGRFKHIHDERFAPQLVSLETGPREHRKHTSHPTYAAVLAEGRLRLADIFDPSAVNRAALADQSRPRAAAAASPPLPGVRFYYAPAPGEAAG